jgi:hypothetical protein
VHGQSGSPQGLEHYKIFNGRGNIIHVEKNDFYIESLIFSHPQTYFKPCGII